MSDRVLVQVENHIALITVNDPERRNAVTAEISAGLRAAVDAAEANTDVHALIVTGAGKAFCAGADLTALGEATEDGLRTIYDGFLAVANCALPTIAAVNGAAVGAGLNLALAADVRIAGPAALFDPRFQKLGIHPGGGATWMLQRAVGVQAARASLLFGMRFDAEAAVRYGLALQVADDPVAAAKELAAGPACRTATGRPRHQGVHAGDRQPRVDRSRSAQHRRRHGTQTASDIDSFAGVRRTVGRRQAQIAR